jgi:hypothetical protein
MASGPVRWPWIASSVPSETFPIGVRFRGWMSEAEGFLCSRLPASLTRSARSGLIPLTQSRPPWSLPRSRAACGPARAATPSCCPTGISDHLHLEKQPLRSCLGATDTPLRTQAVKGPRLPAPRPAAPPGRRTRLSGTAPGRRTRSPGGTDPGGARGHPVRPRSAGSWQRIDGVSRLLPYSDLLALTSSSRRGEGGSDRGSWKRLRILPAGHVDARVEPDIETGAVLIGPAWCLDR